jgi:hypothetical protein
MMYKEKRNKKTVQKAGRFFSIVNMNLYKNRTKLSEKVALHDSRERTVTVLPLFGDSPSLLFQSQEKTSAAFPFIDLH